MTIDIPEKLQPYLGAFGPQAYDSACGEPVCWGYKIVMQCGDEIWSELSALGKLECLRSSYQTSWALITKSLTRKEAEALYGPISEEKFGPKGGWKSVTFGDKTFISKNLKPD